MLSEGLKDRWEATSYTHSPPPIALRSNYSICGGCLYLRIARMHADFLSRCSLFRFFSAIALSRFYFGPFLITTTHSHICSLYILDECSKEMFKFWQNILSVYIHGLNGWAQSNFSGFTAPAEHCSHTKRESTPAKHQSVYTIHTGLWPRFLKDFQLRVHLSDLEIFKISPPSPLPVIEFPSQAENIASVLCFVFVIKSWILWIYIYFYTLIFGSVNMLFIPFFLFRHTKVTL